jgi:hypothetical protein
MVDHEAIVQPKQEKMAENYQSEAAKMIFE